MKNQTCLHFGVSKISLDNPSGEFNPERIILKPFNKIFIFKVEHYWLVWILRKGNFVLTYSIFSSRKVCLYSRRFWVLSTFCSKRWLFLKALLWPSLNAMRSFTFIYVLEILKMLKWNPTTKFTTVFDRHGLQQLLSWCILHW